jgi:hypothetical protein
MISQDAPVTNPNHYVSTVILLILVASVAALVLGLLAGTG